MDEKLPLVSVIMPCYNDGRYIVQSILSVENQKYPYIELIVINDGSDDVDTIKILNKLSKSYRVVNQNNAGPSVARNRGIELAKGEYILPLDSDDIIHPNYISEAVKILLKNPDIGIVYCKAFLFGEKNKVWKLKKFNIHSMLRENMIFVSALFRKSDAVSVGLFSENMYLGFEDWDFWLKLLSKDCGVHRVEEYYFFYRQKKKSRNLDASKPTNKQECYKKIFSNNYELYMKHFSIIFETMYKHDNIFIHRIIRKILMEIESFFIFNNIKKYLNFDHND